MGSNHVLSGSVGVRVRIDLCHSFSSSFRRVACSDSGDSDSVDSDEELES